MTPRRTGFTLVETVMALAIAGLVAMLAYASLSAGLDTDQRVRHVSAATDDQTRWRALASDALRHMLVASLPGQPALRMDPDAMEFRTSALGTPSGIGAAWRVRMTVHDSAAIMRATNEETGAEVVASVPGVTALRFRAQSLGVSGEWQEAWSSPSPPVAVRVDFAAATRAVPPLVVVVGLPQ